MRRQFDDIIIEVAVQIVKSVGRFSTWPVKLRWHLGMSSNNIASEATVFMVPTLDRAWCRYYWKLVFPYFDLIHHFVVLSFI